MLASACVLCLPTIEVQVFCTRLRVEVQGLVNSMVCQSLVLGVKSEVCSANKDVNIELGAKLEILCSSSEVISWSLDVMMKVRV